MSIEIGTIECTSASNSRITCGECGKDFYARLNMREYSGNFSRECPHCEVIFDMRKIIEGWAESEWEIK